MQPAEITQRVSVVRSAFEPSDVYQSPQVSLGGTDGWYMLRSFVPKDGRATAHQLYVRRVYQQHGWIVYERATDDSARSHPVRKISSDVVSCDAIFGCLYVEQVVIELDEQLLRSHVADVVRLQLAGQAGAGKMVIVVPGNYIQGHLAALPR